MSYFVILIVLSLVGLSSCGTGSCPAALPLDICETTCGSSNPCTADKQLCCPTTCGGALCVDAVPRRHFVHVVKICPQIPGGPWICTNTCTSDFDCPRTLKCCINRCGARTCQSPKSVVIPFNENIV